MINDEELKNLIKEQIEVGFNNVKFEVKYNEQNKKYSLIENDRYQLKIDDGSFKIDLNSFEELEDKELLNEDKKIFLNLFKRLQNNDVDHISISPTRLKNPILTAAMGSSILSNVSNQISLEDKRKLYNLWKLGKKKEFKECYQDLVVDIISKQLKNKLESDDLPTPIFPTSVAQHENPNYYINEPKEFYTPTIKIELFSKLVNSICGRCGEHLYGLYVPDEEAKEILREHAPDFCNINIGSIARVGRINLDEVKPFEYMFYILDVVLHEMYRRRRIPNYHVELLVVEGKGKGKKFFSHYIIPHLNEIFEKLYYGDDKYTKRGTSKIKDLIASFLIENWNIDESLKKENSERVHAYINRFLYYLLCHKRLDMDSILFLEDLKIKLTSKKLNNATSIKYLEEVISWI